MAKTAQDVADAISNVIFTQIHKRISAESAIVQKEALNHLTTTLNEWRDGPREEKNILKDVAIEYEVICIKNPHTEKPRVWGSYKTEERARRELRHRKAQESAYEFCLSRTTIRREIID